MQIAKIVPKVKTSGEGIFDYSIPPEVLPVIKIGILVQVPFHGRKVEGIIIDIKKSSKIENLKNIIKIINPNPLVDEVHIKLAYWMSDYYLEPLSKTLFENVIPQAIRSINKDVKDNTAGSNNEKILNNFLIIGDFQSRITFYFNIIKKNIKNNLQTIILIPDLENIVYFKKFLPSAVAIHSQMTRTERFKTWQKIRSDNPNIIIGSISALFAPVKNLGSIIIDQEEAEAFKNDRSPRFHAIGTALTLCKITKTNLVIGSIAPRLETFFKAKKNRFKLLISKKNKSLKISVVDMNFEKEILSFPLLINIQNNLQNKKKVILFLNKKDNKARYICPDCKNQNFFPIPGACPKCQSLNLKQIGISIGRLKKIVEKKFPDLKIALCFKENQKIDKDWNILITTSYILKSALPPIDLIGVIDADQGLNFPDYHSNEKAFNNLYKIISIGKTSIIQTHNPANIVIKSLSKLSYKNFLNYELALRKKTNFPPFCKILILRYLNLNEEKAKQESKKIYNHIIKLLPKTYIINEPSPTFFPKKLNRFCYQIIIKIPINNRIEDDIKEYVLGLKNWIVNMDPIELL